MFKFPIHCVSHQQLIFNQDKLLYQLSTGFHDRIFFVILCLYTIDVNKTLFTCLNNSSVSPLLTQLIILIKTKLSKAMKILYSSPFLKVSQAFILSSGEKKTYKYTTILLTSKLERLSFVDCLDCTFSIQKHFAFKQKVAAAPPVSQLKCALNYCSLLSGRIGSKCLSYTDYVCISVHF